MNLANNTYGYVKILHGSCDGIFNVVGASVASLQSSLFVAFNIPTHAISFVNGKQVSTDFRLKTNDTLEFINKHGRKGVGSNVWTCEEFIHLFKITKEDLQLWINEGLKVRLCLDGSVRITETAIDEFNRGKVIEQLENIELPKEVSTETAATILGLSKDTVLKLRSAGLLQYRNTAPPGSSRPIYRFSLESVIKLRTSYETEAATPRLPKAAYRRQSITKRKYKYIVFD